jgi:hypothetical protein
MAMHFGDTQLSAFVATAYRTHLFCGMGSIIIIGAFLSPLFHKPIKPISVLYFLGQPDLKYRNTHRPLRDWSHFQAFLEQW